MIRSPAFSPVHSPTPNDVIPKWWRTGRQGHLPSSITSMSSRCVMAYPLMRLLFVVGAAAPGESTNGHLPPAGRGDLVSYDPAVRELQTGFWHWQAPHPSWREEADWPELVSSYAIEEGERLLLFDPLALPAELEALAAERATEILLTCPWHRRDADELAGRLGATIFVPPPDEVDQEPVGRDRYAAKVVPDAAFRAGDRPSHGVEAFAGLEPNDL